MTVFGSFAASALLCNRFWQRKGVGAATNLMHCSALEHIQPKDCVTCKMVASTLRAMTPACLVRPQFVRLCFFFLFVPNIYPKAQHPNVVLELVMQRALEDQMVVNCTSWSLQHHQSLTFVALRSRADCQWHYSCGCTTRSSSSCLSLKLCRSCGAAVCLSLTISSPSPPSNFYHLPWPHHVHPLGGAHWTAQ